MIEVATIANTLIQAFQRVHRERMAGLPILHPGLSVAVIGARPWRQDWLGMLLTPLVHESGDRAGRGVDVRRWTRRQQAADRVSGREIASSLHRTRRASAPFAACSMFSPMQTFADQAAAVATAEAIMVALFEPEPGGAQGGSQADVAAASTGAVIQSMRDLLRGRVSRRC